MNEIPRDLNRLIGRALHDYEMLADGDRVLIAVSGGVDSLVLAWVLDHWRKKAPINYDLLAVHIDNGFDHSSGDLIKNELKGLNIPHLIETTDFGARALKAEDGKSVCYHCARQRRNRLFEIARQKKINKIAFGHHKDDLLETFFLNLMFSGNLSTMVPRQDLFAGKAAIIRPLALLEKTEVHALAARIGVTPVKNPCPHDRDSRRQTVRNALAVLYRTAPQTKANMFAALANVREGYLLNTPPGRNRRNHADHP